MTLTTEKRRAILDQNKRDRIAAICAIIEQYKLKQIDIAREANISVWQLSRILRGKVLPRWTTLERIEKIVLI